MEAKDILLAQLNEKGECVIQINGNIREVLEVVAETFAVIITDQSKKYDVPIDEAFSDYMHILTECIACHIHNCDNRIVLGLDNTNESEANLN